MTSASELFSSRRSRIGRNPPDDSLLLHNDLDRDRNRDHLHLDLHRHRLPRRSYRRRLRHADDCDPSHHRHHGASHPEHEFFAPDNFGTIESSTSSRSQRMTFNRANDLSFNRIDRLPGSVLQARARLLERLRGFSLTGSRQSTGVADVSWDEFAVNNDFRAIHSGDWDTESPVVWFEYGSAFADSSVQSEPSLSFQDTRKKPPGLSQEATDSLSREVYMGEAESDDILQASLECSICLEKFSDGDGLIRLPCDHKFHHSCLVPWVRTCGDCPYCRTIILLN